MRLTVKQVTTLKELEAGTFKGCKWKVLSGLQDRGLVDEHCKITEAGKAALRVEEV